MKMKTSHISHKENLKNCSLDFRKRKTGYLKEKEIQLLISNMKLVLKNSIR